MTGVQTCALPIYHSKKIQLFDDVGVVMKYPTIDAIKEIDTKTNDIDKIFSIVASCIDYIYDNETVYHSGDISKYDMDEFLNKLTSEQFVKLEQFFDTLPKMRKEVEYDCPVCGFHNHVTLEGMTSFF